MARSLNIEGHIPSAFQARVAGAKGLWIVDPTCPYDCTVTGEASPWLISVTPSQVKFDDHRLDGSSRRNADTEDRLTFEVVRHSKQLKTAALNTDIITLLEAQGVHRTVFAALLRRHLTTRLTEQKAAMGDRFAFRKWVHDNHPAIAKEDDASLVGCLPSARSDQMALLLDVSLPP